MAAQPIDPTTMTAGASSLRNVPLPTEEESPLGAAARTSPVPTGRKPFLEHFNLTPNRDGVPVEFQEQVANMQEMQKKIADLEALINKMTKNKGHTNKEVDIDDESLKPLHSKDMKPPPEFGGGKKKFLA